MFGLGGNTRSHVPFSGLTPLVIISVIVATLLFIGIISSNDVHSENNDVFIDGEIEYFVISDTEMTVGVGGYFGGTSNLTIPDVVTHDGRKYEVVSIGPYAFRENTSLVTVVLPDHVASIGAFAFSKCTGLTNVNLPDGVTSIGYSAFGGCSAIRTIGIPHGITSIEPSVFRGCSSLTSITIPGSVTVIGEYAFMGCFQLKEFIVAPSNESFVAIDGILFNIDGTELFLCPCGKSGAYEVPSGTKVIRNNAFRTCDKLTSISIPDSVTDIGSDAFNGCLRLTSLIVPDNVTDIGASAFKGCTALTSVSISKNVTRIQNNTFEGCKSLISISLPDGITDIGRSGFYGCSGMTSVSIPEGVVGIGSWAFYGCVSLASIELPDSLTSIGNSAFELCTGLTSITLPDGVRGIMYDTFRGCTGLTTFTIPTSVVEIDSSAFRGCTGLTDFIVQKGNDSFRTVDGVLFNKDLSLLLRYPGGKVGPYTVPNTVTHISDTAFDGSVNLTRINIPKTAPLGKYMGFLNCPSLVDIVLEGPKDGIITIDGAVFSTDGTRIYRCPEGKSGPFTLPDDVCEIHARAFSRTNIDRIVILDGHSIEVGRYAFIGCNPELKFESGKEGFDLEVYSDVERIHRVSISELSSSTQECTLYLKWIESTIPDGPEFGDDTNDMPILMTTLAVGTIVTLVIVAYMLFRRRQGL